MENDKRALRLYLIITFAVSAIVETVWIVFGEAASQMGISSLLMFIPLIAALIVGRKYYKKQHSLGFVRCKSVFLLLAVIFPLAYLGLSYGLFWLVSKGSYVGNLYALIASDAANIQGISDNTAIITSLIVSIPLTFITALGEEAGWRGLMYPVMQRMWGWRKAIVVSGVVWAVWHLPIVIAGLYLPGTAPIYSVPAFIIEVCSLAVIISWIRMKSNSVWPAIMFHAVHNYLDQVIFQSLTNKTGSAYFVGETGIITIIFTAIIAILILIYNRNAFERKDA